MSKPRIQVPDELRDFLEVEHCDDFPIERYYVTKQQEDILHDIIRMRKITSELQKMGIPYLNTTLLSGPTGTGKAQPLSSKILTPKGFIDMGELSVDSTVLTPQGDIATVMGVYPQGVRPIFEIMLTNGRKCLCSDNHLWHVKTPGDREKIKSGETANAYHTIELTQILNGTIKDANKKSLPITDFTVPFLDDDGKVKEDFIKSIKYIKDDKCQCIYIGSPEHLYITDDNIITHNTSLCKYIAHRLDLDFAYINYAKMMSGGVLGDTASNINRVFRYMARTECLFLMDEVDYIATKRGTEGAATGGELSRLTITIMQELDYYKKVKVKSVIMAATNRADQVDPALLSRFAIQKEIGPLAIPEKVAYIEMYLKNVKVPYDKKNILDYCARNIMTCQRDVENDLIRCIARWIDKDRKEPFMLSRISREGVSKQ